MADFEIYEDGILQEIDAVQLNDILKKDITMGNSQYRSSLIELTGLALTLASDTERGSRQDLRIMDTSSSNQYSHYPFDRKLQKYADSSISIHFLFLTPPSQNMPGLVFNEHSEDIFSAFREMALSTGGSVESSANPEYLVNQAVKASENYYLLYYSPLNYKEDGKFKRVEVRVKGEKYKVVHRFGYFAN